MPRGVKTLTDDEILELWRKGWFIREIQKKKHVGNNRLHRVIHNAENRH
jgi:hypothetical protein